jgi:hypothetical protein
MSADLKVVWRKRRNGEWMLFGPAFMLQSRMGKIPVTRADGTTEHRRVWWNSKPFMVNGQEYCYGYPEQKRKCRDCGGLHLRDEVVGNGFKGAYWVRDAEDCSCGGYLAREEEA